MSIDNYPYITYLFSKFLFVIHEVAFNKVAINAMFKKEYKIYFGR